MLPVSIAVDLAAISRAIYPGPTNQRLLKIGGIKFETQAYVHGSTGRGFSRIFVSPSSVVVAFRGTRDRIDWKISNLHMYPEALRDCDKAGARVRVHSGFQRTLEHLDKTTGKRSLHALFDHLDDIEIGKRELYVTGHSLGGALAILFAVKLRAHRPQVIANNLRSICVFGSPGVGSWGFHDYYAELSGFTTRFVNAYDCVPFMPPIGYRHVGREVWLREDGLENDAGWRRRLMLSLAVGRGSSYVRDHSIRAYYDNLKRMVAKLATSPDMTEEG